MPDIKKFETIAMLDLPDIERKQLEEAMESIEQNFKLLESIDTDGVEPLVTVLGLHSVLREDVAIKTLEREEIMSNAPEQHDGYFMVPGTLET